MKTVKISKNIYGIPKEKGMNVPGRIYASEKIFENIKNDKSLEQVKNVAHLPGIIEASIALTDCHQGYGFCIGGVAAFDLEKGIISPGGVGYDINCGVRLLTTNLKRKDILGRGEEILKELSRKIPTGVGRGSPFQMSKKIMNGVLSGGAKYLVEAGYGKKEDYLNVEEEGCLESGDPLKVSERAIKRGIGQLGTLGAGNHFLDVLIVEELFDKVVAKAFGLKKDQVVIMIHCGSRGLGHQVASDYIKKMEEKYGFEELSDRELINAPIKSELGQDYLSAMKCASNFAFANRQLITHWVRESMVNLFKDIKINVLYDVCHNIAKVEKHVVGGKKREICVHRKGATRSFGPGRIEIPQVYRKVGQPVLIPGSMGTSSYVLVGTKKAEEMTFGSTVHGAGRVMSRSRAYKEFTGEEVKEKLKKKNILVKSSSMRSLVEESPDVYKDIEDVVGVVGDLGISLKVAKLKPFLVLIG